MVDISEKKPVRRTAVAEGKIFLKKSTMGKIKNKKIKKGDPLTVAEIAAINAVKDTPRLIPLCHQIPISKVETSFAVGTGTITARTTVTAVAKTGVEMEALAGVSAALLTIWDMVKYLEKDENGQYPDTRIADVRVVEKVKGR